MVNVVGNCLATVVVSKWEGNFVEASDEQLAKALLADERLPDPDQPPVLPSDSTEAAG